MFENIQLYPADPILGIIDIFCSDRRNNKVNLGIGVYKDEYGHTQILNSVKKAESILLNNETSKNYLNIEGMQSFIACTQQLLLGINSSAVNMHRVTTVQTPGGTGALRIAADFLIANKISHRVWISQPTWPNHYNVFCAAGLDVSYYTYYDTTTRGLNFNSMLADLSHASSGDVVLFHGCCHNPTGIDLNIDQWNILLELSVKNNWLPLFDCAYQGFGNGLNCDVKGIRMFCDLRKELLICSSYSKNFGLYNERVGACTVVANDASVSIKVLSQLKRIIRANYSNPPAHGAAIISTILNDSNLFDMWKKELDSMRRNISYIRNLLVDTLHKMDIHHDYNFLNEQNGMFCFFGFNIKQVLELRKKFAVYMTDSGRINIAGITLDNIEYVCSSIVSVF